MTSQKDNTQEANTLEQLVAHTCFCKLRTHCHDKSSGECLKHKNLYAEFMAQKRIEHEVNLSQRR